MYKIEFEAKMDDLSVSFKIFFGEIMFKSQWIKHQTTESQGKNKQIPMEHQFLHMIIAPLKKNPNLHDHSVFIRLLWTNNLSL